MSRDGYVTLTAGRLEFDWLSMQGLLSRVDAPTSGWKVVVTPNARHLTLLEDQPSLLSIYHEAALVIPDGWPVTALLRRSSGLRWRRLAGSDLVEQILSRPGRSRPLVFVGGDGSANFSAALLERARESGWNGSIEPAPGVDEYSAEERAALIRRIGSAAAGGVVLLGLGAPRQELLAHDLASAPGDGWILCVGMGISFSAGAQNRAPEWAQTAGLEWAHRIWQEPRRLGPRYVRDALTLARLTIREKEIAS